MDELRAQDQYETVIDAFAGREGVSLPGEGPTRGFGSHALKVNNSIFAMLVRGHLVVKLPRQRVAELIDSDVGIPFDANKGKPMKEWLTVVADEEATWLALAEEAWKHVGRLTPPKTSRSISR